MLFTCGRNQRAVIASLNILNGDSLKSVNASKDEVSFLNIIHMFYTTFPCGFLSSWEGQLHSIIGANMVTIYFKLVFYVKQFY